MGSAGFALSKKEENPVLGFGDFPLSSFPPPPGGCDVLTLFQESAELAAGGFKRPLLLFGVCLLYTSPNDSGMEFAGLPSPKPAASNR